MGARADAGCRLTATLAYNTYPEEPARPASVHRVRALGGPGGNLLLELVALTLHRLHPRSRALACLGWLNLQVTAAGLPPAPTMDSGAALRAWRRRTSER